MKISELYSLYKLHPVVTTDSRVILPDSIFFALKGATFNGNEFAKTTIDSGCAFAVVDEEKYAIDDRFILVDDVLKSLQDLARFHREKLNIPVFGITGTNGKTTTKELLSVVLSEKYKTVFTKGNLNNHIGVPLTVLSIYDDAEIAIVEMGANHPGEIAFLCEIAQPTHGLITNIGKAHLEGFGSFEGVKKTKNELYDYLYSHNGTVFVNSGNPILMDLIKSRLCITYGVAEHDYCRGEINHDKIYLEADIELNEAFIGGKILSELQNPIPITITSNLVGAYNLENLLAAVSIGNYFGVEAPEIKNAIQHYQPDNNRSQLLKTEKNTIVMDAYNANPSSMEQALNNFLALKQNGKAAILGEMLELGEYCKEEHLKLITLLGNAELNPLYLVGNSFTDIDTTGFTCFENVDQLCMWLEQHPVQGKNILIKGSRGNKLEKVLPFL